MFREKEENSCLEILIATNMCTNICMNFAILENKLLYYDQLGLWRLM